jgi:hypothetical protein
MLCMKCNQFKLGEEFDYKPNGDIKKWCRLCCDNERDRVMIENKTGIIQKGRKKPRQATIDREVARQAYKEGQCRQIYGDGPRPRRR